MKKLIPFSLVLFLGFSFFLKAEAKKKKKIELQEALTALTKMCHQESVVEIFKNHVSYEDYKYLKKLFHNELASKVPFKLAGKNQLLFKGKKIQFRMNGQELVYKGLGFRLKSHLSLRKNIENFAKRLSSSKGMNVQSLFIEKAYGTEQYNVEVLREAGWLASALNYTSEYLKWDSENQNYKMQAKISEDEKFYRIIKNTKPISNITCTNTGTRAKLMEHGQMTIFYEDGTRIEFHRGYNKKEGRIKNWLGKTSQGYWHNHAADPHNEKRINGAMRAFCSYPEKARKDFLSGLKETQQKSKAGTNSSQ